MGKKLTNKLFQQVIFSHCGPV